VNGNNQANLINGGEGNDTLSGNGGADTINGNGGDDLLFGGNQNDILSGGSGNDTIVGGANNDQIFGGPGDDLVIWNVGDGRDLIDGGAGTDTFEVNGNNSPETFRLYTRDYWANDLGKGTANLHPDTQIIVARNGNPNANNFYNNNVIAELRGIEEIVINGGGGANTYLTFGDFTGTGLAYNTITLVGDAGDDTIDISSLQSDHRIVFRSSGGNDRLIGTLRPQDVIVLAAGTVIADYAEAANSDGSVTLTGAGHSITFTGTPRIATADEVIGDYEAAVSDMPTADAPDAPEVVDEVPVAAEPAPTSAPSVQFGTTGKDAMVGTAGRDILFGDAGNDDILAGDGADMVFGDEGDDRIFGQGGDDYINAGAGNDTVFGGDGNDVIVAQVGDGNDVYYGDDGTDTLDMSAITANITANLGTGHMERGFVSSAQTGQDVIWSIENIITGSGDDVITASGAVNVIDGGEGNDTFRFLSAGDADGDTIVTFNPGDRLDLSAIDANAGAAGKQGFTIVSGGLTGPGQLMITLAQMDGQDVTLVQGKTTDGDEADFTIQIKGAHDLTASDFNL
ncbi:MAG: calcium-binding protein, partial [Paracoccaceae bacterium]